MHLATDTIVLSNVIVCGETFRRIDVRMEFNNVPASLCFGLAHEIVLPGQIAQDGVALRQLQVALDVVREVGEIQTYGQTVEKKSENQRGSAQNGWAGAVNRSRES